ncbi:unnamed protein product [Phytomonas sp. Hart1]|nr:unnamed protein product [Phytomonas sp. Hart1]|eukprot:CCW68746.1 unnamed protein product [Phytomonas sp. isolate Hart1]
MYQCISREGEYPKERPITCEISFFFRIRYETLF